jgi:hypothetical protein
LKQSFDKSYSVITVATNNLKYVEFALNCTQSVLLHNDINVYIISNLSFDISAYLQKNVKIVKADEEQAALGIGIKTYINQYIQTEHTLFIDSDCLCLGSLKPIFEAFTGKDVSVVGTIVKSAEWCGDQQAKVIEEQFGIKQLPRFNGGLYYLKMGEKTNLIFELAQSIIPNYDTFGFNRIKNRWINEEGLIAIAMMMHKQTPIVDDGRYMTDLSTDSHPQLNVLKGIKLLKNPPLGKPRHRAWYPAVYSPIVLHFGGSNGNTYIYRSQIALLKLYQQHISKNLATLLVHTFIHIPFRSLRWIIGSLKKLKTS